MADERRAGAWSTSGPSRRGTSTGSSPSTGRVATLAMDVQGGRRPPARLRAEAQLLRPRRGHRALRRHPAAALRASGSAARWSSPPAKERVFCAGANIRMLSQSSHGWKVNFCKFTNETRNAHRGGDGGVAARCTSAAVNGPCAGGGYELALATDRIIMADDGIDDGGAARGAAARRAARAPAGSRGWWTSARSAATAPTSSARSRRASRASARVEWRLVDEVVPRSRARRGGEAPRRPSWPRAATARRRRAASRSRRSSARIEGDRIALPHVDLRDRPRAAAWPRSR